MRIYLLWGINLVGLAALAGYLFYAQSKIPKMGVARTAYILEKSKPMAQLRNTLTQRREFLKLELDSLGRLIQARQMTLQKQNQTKEPAAQADVQELYLWKSQLQERAQAFDQMEQKLTQGALNQINTKVEEYAKKNGFHLVLGGNFQGSILYGAEWLDVSDPIIDFINNESR